jgi:hypothetical protein
MVFGLARVSLQNGCNMVATSSHVMVGVGRCSESAGRSRLVVIFNFSSASSCFEFQVRYLTEVYGSKAE